MLRVVIVDDEPIIVEGLCRIVDWTQYGCTVAGCAESGQDGLALVEKEKPELLITDIRMPGMDGLSMIAALKSQYPKMKIIILTGYREFEYARSAIRLGVHRFLLKPSKMEELDEALRSAVAELMENRTEEGGTVAGEDTSSQADGKAMPCAPDLASQGTTSPAGNFVVEQALRYMRQHYREKLQLTDVADHVYVTYWHLSKLLNSTTGRSFSELLGSIRIEHAIELMKDPSRHIADIAEEVGFGDLTHFARVFRKQTGMSANEYQNAHL